MMTTPPNSLATALPPLTMRATAKTRMNLALHHLFAACRFSARILEIEGIYKSQSVGAFWEEILHNALGVATLTAACLECYANEFYFEGSILANTLNSPATSAIADLIDKESVLRKYEVALAIRSGKTLPYGDLVIQNVDALIKLRNAVVHFRPEWFAEPGAHERLSRRLNQKFDPSPFLSGEPLFPSAWASASFASWALATVVEFLDYFCLEAGIANPLDPFRERLSEYSGNAL